jgi:hypothetical protein
MNLNAPLKGARFLRIAAGQRMYSNGPFIRNYITFGESLIHYLKRNDPQDPNLPAPPNRPLHWTPHPRLETDSKPPLDTSRDNSPAWNGFQDFLRVYAWFLQVDTTNNPPDPSDVFHSRNEFSRPLMEDWLVWGLNPEEGLLSSESIRQHCLTELESKVHNLRMAISRHVQ